MQIQPSGLRFTVAPKPRARTAGIVCHHTTGSASQRPEGIHAYHKSRGWAGCGYHLLQTKDAVWWEGRPLDTEGAHASGYNGSTVGVSLIGDFEANPLPQSRYESLIECLVWLCRRYSLAASDIRGHRELPGAATLCPGKHIDMARVRADVHAQLHPPSAAPMWRVSVDGERKHALRDPLPYLSEVLGTSARSVLLERVA